jgi:D-beta-D-heptose 7-phosphate kinase/D-beta-D-heptose 1-phosphate adenosyltransferase
MPKVSRRVLDLSKAKVLVVGDAIDDVYHFGRVERICPEAPVPVFIPERTETRPGGALNVEAQINALGAYATCLYGGKKSRKTRFMSGAHLLLRSDEDDTRAATDAMVIRMREFLADKGAFFNAVVISDYAKGLITVDMAQAVIYWARQHKIPVIVDPKGTNWGRYTGCSLICPNRQELQEWSDSPVLLKMGADGMKLNGTVIPAVAKKVYDVTGAGDCVVAVVAAAVAAGATFLEAAKLAALAAGVAVGKVGTAVCTKEELEDAIKNS